VKKKVYRIYFIVLLCISFFIQSQFDFDIKYINSQPVVALDDLLSIRKDIDYLHVCDCLELYREPYPLSMHVKWWMQDPIILPKRFILTIPQGHVYSRTGFVIVNDFYIDELLWELTRQEIVEKPVSVKNLRPAVHVHGRVVVLTQAGSWNYYHWMTEILPKLAMLQEHNIEYDYLYLSLDRAYMRETVQLLGIDSSIILEPVREYRHICADELIVPSLVSSFCYTPQFAIDFLRESFIPRAQESVSSEGLSKRIFISRRKASSRKIKNEDEVFALFERYGFVRYNLEEMSVLEQVMLFHNAEFIAGEHGAGLTNIIFAQADYAQVIEVFQAREDATYWYLSQEVGLQHHCIKTIEFDKKTSLNGGFVNSKVPLESIKSFLADLFGVLYVQR